MHASTGGGEPAVGGPRRAGLVLGMALSIPASIVAGTARAIEVLSGARFRFPGREDEEALPARCHAEDDAPDAAPAPA